MHNQTITHNDLFFSVSFEDITRSIEIPANTVKSQTVWNEGITNVTLSVPDHNPEDYTYGLFTER